MLDYIRCSCDETPFRDVPWISAVPMQHALPQHAANVKKRALAPGIGRVPTARLLRSCSEERDTTWWACTSRQIQTPKCLSVEAARHVASYVGFPLLEMTLHFPEMRQVGADISHAHEMRILSTTPYPHGRDIPIAVIARHSRPSGRCDYVAFGHEKESRQKKFVDGDREILRHDVESDKGHRMLQDYLDASSERDDLSFPLAGTYLIIRKAPR